MATGIVGDSIRLRVTFYAWSESSEEAEIEDPDVAVLHIYLDDASPELILTTTPTQESVGVYYYTWTPSVEGEYLIRFIGTFDDASTDVVEVNFTISESSPGETVTSGISLGIDFEYQISGVIDPLYIDPEEIQEYFPEESGLEIAELIHKYSLQIKDLLSLSDDEEPPWIALEWIAAQVSCDLSRRVEWTAGATNVNMVQLGDLMVKTGGGGMGGSGNLLTRDSATTWCELAGALWRELLMSKTQVKTFVKGSVYTNPIPNRQLRDWEKDGRFYADRPVMQGLLDGLTGSR